MHARTSMNARPYSMYATEEPVSTALEVTDAIATLDTKFRRMEQLVSKLALTTALQNSMGSNAQCLYRNNSPEWSVVVAWRIPAQEHSERSALDAQKKLTLAYNRTCPHGPGMMGPHKDIDECKNNLGMTFGICENGKCSNMMKDFKCICNDGFVQSPLSNKLCDDVDECKDSSFCQGGKCENSIGGYACHCPTGFQYNTKSRTCEDLDECALENPASVASARTRPDPTGASAP